MMRTSDRHGRLERLIDTFAPCVTGASRSPTWRRARSNRSPISAEVIWNAGPKAQYSTRLWQQRPSLCRWRTVGDSSCIDTRGRSSWARHSSRLEFSTARRTRGHFASCDSICVRRAELSVECERPGQIPVHLDLRLQIGDVCSARQWHRHRLKRFEPS